MATMPKGGKNAKRGEPTTVPIPEVIRNVFGEQPENDLAVDFGEIHPTALHSVISRVCRAGGYIGLSAPAGGAAIKLRVTIGDAGGERWIRSGHELAAYFVTLKKFLDDEHPQ